MSENLRYHYKKLFLASSSARRKELLAQLGVQYIQIDNDFDEVQLAGESPKEYVERLALGKAESAKKKMSQLEFPVLGADTIVVLNNKCLGKPKDLADAANMLAKLSDNTHQVMTSVCVTDAIKTVQATSCSWVTFDKLTEHQIARYCGTEESLGKAGSYAIQGVAASFIKRLEGSYTGVVGLPLRETSKILEEFKIKSLLS